MDADRPQEPPKEPEWPKDWHPETDGDDIAEARERDQRKRQRKPKPVKKPRRSNWFNI